MSENIQPTDADMLDWMIINSTWCGDIFYNIENDPNPLTPREAIAAEMKKEMK